jgi:ribonucleotide monophosphatase NagD (HAD superfamily)
MSLLGGIDAVVFDVDGTLLHANDPSGPRGARPIAGAVETLERVRASGRQVLFFTNGTGRPPASTRRTSARWGSRSRTRSS